MESLFFSFKGHKEVFILRGGLEDENDGVEKKFNLSMWLNISLPRQMTQKNMTNVLLGGLLFLP